MCIRCRGGAGLLGRRSELLAEVSGAAVDPLAHLLGELSHRVVEVLLEVGEVELPCGDFTSAGIGDRVGPLAAVLGALDQTLFLQLGQPWIHGPGAGGVEPIEAFLERLDDLVAMAGALVQQCEQIEAHLAMGEDGHRQPAFSLSGTVSWMPVARSTTTLPDSEFALMTRDLSPSLSCPPPWWGP